MNQGSLFNLMPERRTWKVSELTTRIRELLEGNFPDISVEGEVSNCRAAQSGHYYFTLKDARSQIRCVCFRDQMRGIKCKPEDGLHITVRGSLSVYDARGEYQIYVTNIDPVGLGALQLAFEQLKKRLLEEGLFEAAKKKALPVLPRSIGVVTSPTGAAIRDILRVLNRRFPNAHVTLFPVKVQGAGSAVEVVQALRYFNRVKTIDVLILARGGGSLEDLWTFNEETVARAIFESVIPVITGIGHETDFTIADFVSDVRAPTPSAAAEIVVRSRDEFERHIAEHARRISQQMRFHLSQWKHHVRDLQTHRGFRRLDFLLRERRQLVDDYSSSLLVGLRRRLAMARQRVTDANARVSSFDLRGRAAVLRRHIELQRGNLRTALDRTVTRKQRALNLAQMRFAALDLRARLAGLRHRYEQNDAQLRVQFERIVKLKRRQFDAVDTQRIERDPLRILQRGYSIAYDSVGKVLRSIDQVAVGDGISVRLAHGELAATVSKKKKTNKAF
ncbi:MAG TPA: exodeoxyribonuclease VII large subunit [Candidatus Acidoferrales bacterium]